ncbi:hydrolase [Marinilabilia rubra]|uniref:Hydrolase n=1 Tax=Marinilabilia rubra TaxID=2162893 RepID=A0A2U2B4W9_9BACT|nr:hydrolase [Marinilabilia rubra]PWD98105.1 hydrolase [Marinilabilia rubra]
MRITKDSALAMVVDVQERLFPHIYENEQLEKNIKILVDGLKTLGIPVIVTEQYKKGLGETIPSLATMVEEYPHNEKTAFSCCDDPGIMETIELTTRRSVILAGIESHICLLQTALDLKERGFHPIVIEDCVGSRNPENKRIAMTRLVQEGVLISSYESILFELCRFAGTDQFKAISKLVK